ncbi:MAG: proprotein convertase P-domain-containing protein [Nitrospira sp.]
MGAFNGTSPNGAWQLFVKDDSGQDQGSIANGWELIITTN